MSSKAVAPDRVKIGAQIWAIDYRTRAEDGMLNDGCYGYTLEPSNLIVIEYGIPLNKQQSTVIHEILHAARMTFDNTGRPAKKAEFLELEHFFIGVWEQALLQIIQDNTGLLLWLQKR